jgi:hypothetical protein
MLVTHIHLVHWNCICQVPSQTLDYASSGTGSYAITDYPHLGRTCTAAHDAQGRRHQVSLHKIKLQLSQKLCVDAHAIRVITEFT